MYWLYECLYIMLSSLTNTVSWVCKTWHWIVRKWMDAGSVLMTHATQIFLSLYIHSLMQGVDVLFLLNKRLSSVYIISAFMFHRNMKKVSKQDYGLFVFYWALFMQLLIQKPKIKKMIKKDMPTLYGIGVCYICAGIIWYKVAFYYIFFCLCCFFILEIIENLKAYKYLRKYIHVYARIHIP